MDDQAQLEMLQAISSQSCCEITSGAEQKLQRIRRAAPPRRLPSAWPLPRRRYGGVAAQDRARRRMASSSSTLLTVSSFQSGRLVSAGPDPQVDPRIGQRSALRARRSRYGFADIERRALEQQTSEHARLDENGVQRRDSPVRRSAEPGRSRPRRRRDNCARQRAAPRASRTRRTRAPSGSRVVGISIVLDRQILAAAPRHAVIDADDDERRNATLADAAARRFPRPARCCRRRRAPGRRDSVRHSDTAPDRDWRAASARSEEATP